MAGLNDLITAKGDEGRVEVERGGAGRQKTNYLKLKNGESTKVMFITTEFVNYYSHGDFNKHVGSHTCIDPKNGVNCPSCMAKIPRTKKTLVPLWDIVGKQVVVFDCVGKHMKSVYAAMDVYKNEDGTVDPAFFEAVFDVSRSGEKLATTYTFMPMPRISPDMKKLVLEKNVSSVSDDFFLGVLNPMTAERMEKFITGKKDDEPAEGGETGGTKAEDSSPVF